MASKRILPAFVLALLAALSMLGVTSAGFGPSQGGGGSGGGGGSQTPWTSDIDAAGYDLTGVGDLTVSGVTSATVGAQTVTLAGNSNTTLTAAQCRGHTYYADVGSGTTPVTLPTPVLGLRVTFVAASNAIQITAAAETDIKTPDSTAGTADGGYLLSKTTNATVTLESLNTQSGWRVVSITGTWARDSTTSAGFAYTPSAWASWTPTSTSWVSNVTFTGAYRQEGDVIHSRITATLSGAATAAQLQINNWAGGFAPSITKFPRGTRWTRTFTGGASDTSGAGSSAAFATLSAWIYSTEESGSNAALYVTSHSATVTNDGVTHTVPWTWANGDTLTLYGSYGVD